MGLERGVCGEKVPVESKLRLIVPVAGLVFGLGGEIAFAQERTEDTSSRLTQSATAPATSAASSMGDGGQGGKPAWLVQPRISLTETFTDNAGSGNTALASKSDQITQISPGIRIEGRGARLKGYFDYSLNQIYYVQNSQRNQTQNALNAMGTLEAIENWMFIDLTGSITQQQISAFGAQSASNTSINSNRTETSTYGISPYVRGRLLGVADYMIRYNRTTSDSSSGAFGNDTDSWVATLSGDTGLASLGWAADASTTAVDYSNGRHIQADRYNGTLIWRLDPQFRLRASAGEESNNYVTQGQHASQTYGYGFDWAPTERTSVSAFREHRFFGNGHHVEFHHRTPLTAWSFMDTRDAMITNQAGTAAIAT